MSDQKIKIGDKVKILRAEQGLSVKDLAERSGITETAITGIEDHTLSPPLGDIVSLAKAFHVTVGEFFGDSADSPFCLVRSDDRKAVTRFSSASGASGGYSYESLGHQKQNRRMEPFLVTLTPAEVPQLEPNQHVGEEIIFVLEGQVQVRLAEHTEILNKGDSIYYDSTMPHIVSCYGAGLATILAVIYARKEMLII